MTNKQKTTVNQIVKELISITLNYTNDSVEKDLLVKIQSTYNNTNCNITKGYYAEINNLIDQQIGNVLSEREKRQQVQEYIVAISEKIAAISNDSNFKNLIKYIGSYIEVHMSTYSSMLNGIEDTMDTQKQYNVQISDAKNELKNSRNQLIKTKDTIDNLLPNLLTVLSILISIVVAVVIVYITVFLEKDNTSNPIIENLIQVNFAQYVLCIHVVGDLFFLMMFMIARLTNRTILTTCNHFEWKPKIPDEYKDSYTTEFHRFACADCSVDCSFAKKLKRKSAYIIYFNVLMILLYFVLYIWWIFDHYINNKKYFLNTGDFWFIISIATISILVLSFLFVKKKCVKNIQNSFVEKLNLTNCYQCCDLDVSLFKYRIVFPNIKSIKKTYNNNNCAYIESKNSVLNYNLLKNIANSNGNSQEIEYRWIHENKSYVFLYNLVTVIDKLPE